uniref:Uncharacterized protein n=1 Tax=Ditylenchus dipsaci TaxID=166011 RepID=A0A915D319_9BILA
MAAPPHTTLLLGVYIKMNATDKLNTFLEQSAKLKGFDVEGAIQICLYLDQYGHVLMEHPDIENELLELIKKAVVSENANVKQLVNVLINSNKADKLEEVFDQMSSVKPVEDVFMRNAVLEQRLKTFAKKGSISPQKSRNIIELVNTDNYEQALHLGQIYKFAPLVIHILRQQNRLEDMLRFLLKEGDINDIIQCCGEEALKNMWIELITYVSAKENLEPKSLVALLEKVSETKSNFVHPLVVLEILSRNNVLQVADVKDYIVKWLENQNNLIKDNQAGIQLNEKKIDEMDKAIEDLENNVQIFQTTKCSTCRDFLSIPAEHNSDQPDQCPLCVTTNNPKGPDVDSTAKLLSHQSFCDELDSCTDPISFISQYISNGVFDRVKGSNNN